MSDYHTKPRSHEELEKLALTLRMQHGLAQPPSLDLMRLVDSMKVSVVERPDSELDHCEGRALVEDRRIELRASVLQKLHVGEGRARMTLAHEIAHIALQHIGAPNTPKLRAIAPRGNSYHVPKHHSSEWQASRFASCLLMLRQHVVACKSADELAGHCCVSKQAAQYRFDEVNGRAPRDTPKDVAAGIARLKALVAAEDKPRSAAKSFLTPDILKRLAWESAPEAPDMSKSEYRLVDGRYVVRWSRYGEASPGGWRLQGDRIEPWEKERFY